MMLCKKTSKIFVHVTISCNTSRSITSRRLIFNEFGDPLKVIKLEKFAISHPTKDQVLVRMLASPINLVDVNNVLGAYGKKANPPPYLAGTEGVGIAEEVGKGVQEIKPGNKVIFTKPVPGTWSEVANFKKSVLKVVPDDLGIVEAATLANHSYVAYRILSDFIPVRERNGFVLIQNGANSACGQNIIQICKAWGIKTVNIIRNRPRVEELKQYLTELGATYVLTEEEARSTNIFDENKIERPSLALNCVSGQIAFDTVKHVQKSGKMVTYGGTSMDPVMAPIGAFIYKNITLHGYWLKSWKDTASPNQVDEMVNGLFSMIRDNKLKGPLNKMVQLENYREALAGAINPKGFVGYKYILDMTN